MSHNATNPKRRVLVAGATGYLGKFVAREFRRQGHWVRVLTRDRRRLEEAGPFTAPALGPDDVDDVFIGEATKPETLEGLLDGIDLVFSSIGISRQRDGLTFEQVDYQANRNLIDLCEGSSVERFGYVSMLGADQIADLAIAKAHERIVDELEQSTIPATIVRPSGYFSDMGAVLDMAKRGRVFLVGTGDNSFNPIHGQDLAQACVEACLEGRDHIEVGGPETMTQKDVAELAFALVGKKPKYTTIPFWLTGAIIKLTRRLNQQIADLIEFIVTAGEVDGVGPKSGTITLEAYYRDLLAGRTTGAGEPNDDR